MIKMVTGDILMTQAQAIAHGIAPHDHFNQGLALALRERFPSMAKDFRHYCHLQNPEAGDAWLWAGPERVIVNLMTQDAAEGASAHPKPATITHVRHALKALRKIIQKQDIKSLAMPCIATGVGGLAWEEVLPLIEQALGDLDIPIIIYETYVKGKKANEGLAAAA